MASAKSIASKITKLKVPTYSASKATNTYKKSYTSGDKAYNKKIDTLLNSAKSMGTFDPEKSAYYQSSYNALKDYAVNQGRRNMQSVIADAAATNTGGYGNSYATSAGASAFQNSLNKLTSQLSALYSQASDDFYNKKNDIYSQASAWSGERDYAQNKNLNLWNYSIANDQNKYSNSMDKYNANLAKYQLLLNQALKN